jgi:hypothetical protein
LVNKLSEKANPFCTSYRISFVKGQKSKSKTTNAEEFDREWVRILKILKNTFYQACETLADEILPDQPQTEDFQYQIIECPIAIQKLIELFENVSHDTTCSIFPEICQVLCTLWAQSQRLKRCFSMSLNQKKYCGIQPVIKAAKSLNFNSKGSEIPLILNLLTSLWMVTENVKNVIKSKLIEEIIPKLLLSNSPWIINIELKSEKDILNCKVYITNFVKFLAAFTYNEEGVKAIAVSFWNLGIDPP